MPIPALVIEAWRITNRRGVSVAGRGIETEAEAAAVITRRVIVAAAIISSAAVEVAAVATASIMTASSIGTTAAKGMPGAETTATSTTKTVAAMLGGEHACGSECSHTDKQRSRSEQRLS